VSFVRASAESENRRMFKHKKRILPFALTPPPEQFFLPGQCLRILNQAKINALKAQHKKLRVQSFSIHHSAFIILL
jgi:hypothetical protein